ncbi:hypothetical protein PAPYR_9263 [Paratrimastix pyriformis]|uniref:non-specific serine/threonine protein kinase n=1 Tax=Paratrimastix pyriformis TaxID=342808 RepID=A0ABQ8UBB9_9EUKA|nr:hypothetical protein PAPYR_9263 [Paratrimastix pyriformis]
MSDFNEPFHFDHIPDTTKQEPTPKTILRHGISINSFLVAQRETSRLFVLKEFSCPSAQICDRLVERMKLAASTLSDPRLLIPKFIFRGHPSIGDPSAHCLCLCTDFCPLGNWDVNCGKILPEQQRDHFAQEIYLAMAHLHSRGIIHGNIKPTNVLFSGTSGDLDHVVLADWFGPELLELRPAAQGTDDFQSPELATQAPITPHTDLFSAGLVFTCIYGSLTTTGLRAFLGGRQAWAMREPELDRLVQGHLGAMGTQAAITRGVAGLLTANPAQRQVAMQGLVIYWYTRLPPESDDVARARPQDGEKSAELPVTPPQPPSQGEQLVGRIEQALQATDLDGAAVALDELSCLDPSDGGLTDQTPLSPRLLRLLSAILRVAGPSQNPALTYALASCLLPLIQGGGTAADTNATMLGQAGAVELLLDALGQPGAEDYRLAGRVWLCLAVLLHAGAQNQVAFGKTPGGLATLIAWMGSPVTIKDPLIPFALAGVAVALVSDQPQLHQTLLQAGLRPALVSLLRAAAATAPLGAAPGLVPFIHNILAPFCATPEEELQWAEAGLPAAATALLGALPQEDDASREVLCDTIQILDSQPATSAAFLHAGMLACIEDLLAHPELHRRPAAVAPLLKTVASLEGDEALRATAPLCAKLVEMTRELQAVATPGQMRDLLLALANMSAAPENAHRALAAGGLRLVSNLLVDPRMTTDPGVCDPLLVALGNLVQADPGRPELEEVVGPVVGLLARPAGWALRAETAAATSLCFAVMALANTKKLARQMLARGVAEPLAAMISDPSLSLSALSPTTTAAATSAATPGTPPRSHENPTKGEQAEGQATSQTMQHEHEQEQQPVGSSAVIADWSLPRFLWAAVAQLATIPEGKRAFCGKPAIWAAIHTIVTTGGTRVPADVYRALGMLVLDCEANQASVLSSGLLPVLVAHLRQIPAAGPDPAQHLSFNGLIACLAALSEAGTIREVLCSEGLIEVIFSLLPHRPPLSADHPPPPPLPDCMLVGLLDLVATLARASPPLRPRLAAAGAPAAMLGVLTGPRVATNPAVGSACFEALAELCQAPVDLGAYARAGLAPVLLASLADPQLPGGAARTTTVAPLALALARLCADRESGADMTREGALQTVLGLLGTKEVADSAEAVRCLFRLMTELMKAEGSENQSASKLHALEVVAPLAAKYCGNDKVAREFERMIEFLPAGRSAGDAAAAIGRM